MDKPRFVYVTYISSSPQKVWNALIDPETTAKYWQHENVSDWKPGSRWEHRAADKDRTLRLVGKVIESSPPKRLVMTWALPADDARPEKHSRVTFEIEPVKDVVRLKTRGRQFARVASVLPDGKLQVWVLRMNGSVQHWDGPKIVHTSDVTNNYGPLDEVGIGGKLVEQYITEDHAAEQHG